MYDEITTATVNIDGREYELVENTIETAEKLERIDREMAGKQPEYKIWLAEIEVLLGKEEYSEIFVSGKSENIDRIHRIHSDIVRAFNRAYDEIEAENNAQMDELARRIAPINELLKRVQSFEQSHK